MSGILGGSSGNSSTANSQSTTSTDGRVVGGDSSTNLSLNGNKGPVQITTTDAGAIHQSLALALAGVEGANATAAAATSNAISAVQQGQAQFTSAVEQIKTGDKTTKVVVIGAVVAAVAIAFAMRKA